MIALLQMLRDPSVVLAPADGRELLMTAALSLAAGVGVGLLVRWCYLVYLGRTFADDVDRARAL